MSASPPPTHPPLRHIAVGRAGTPHRPQRCDGLHPPAPHAPPAPRRAASAAFDCQDRPGARARTSEQSASRRAGHISQDSLCVGGAVSGSVQRSSTQCPSSRCRITSQQTNSLLSCSRGIGWSQLERAQVAKPNTQRFDTGGFGARLPCRTVLAGQMQSGKQLETNR